MKINFLSAIQPLVKTYSENNPPKPYPFVSNFTSHETNIANITDLYQALKTHADKGNCLLKGTVTNPLHNESRAGSTNPHAPTRLVVLDIDRCSDAITTPEQFIKQCLPTEFHNAEYIWQWSNSAKITKNHLAGHFFFILHKEVTPSVLKNILAYYNLSNEYLSEQIKLSANGLSLTYPLDITCAQNDKLIFIAPPNLINIKDPFTNDERIVLVTNKKAAFVHLNTEVPFTILETLKKNKLDQLRTAIGLPRKKEKYKNDILINPEQAVFRGPYIHARGFVYGNLNNGDSYAYFHTETNPFLLYNFKGEPNVRIQDIDPDYWQSLSSTPKKTDTSYYAFRERLSDTYYTLIYNSDDSYTLNTVSNLQKAISFLKLHQSAVPEELPIWDIVFAPNENFSIDFTNQRINSFQKTEFLKNATPSTKCPTKFYELVNHVVGNDLEMVNEFINWLAYIVQKREKTQTAFILHGRTGTGKGVLFTKVIQPILGATYCTQVLLEELDREFNEAFANALLIMFDEAAINEAANKTRRRINKIKNFITEPDILIKKKYCAAYTAKNYANFIFASNEHDSFILDEQDRRFKVCPRQEHPLNYSTMDIAQLTSELQSIANYLIGYQVNEKKVFSTQLNQAKRQLIEAGRYGIDEFIHIIKTGNLEPLLNARDSYPSPNVAVYNGIYTTLLQEWEASVDKEIEISITDLKIAYCYMSGEDMSATRFGKCLKQKGITAKTVWLKNRTTKAITVNWYLSEEYITCSPNQLLTQNSVNTKNVPIH